MSQVEFGERLNNMWNECVLNVDTNKFPLEQFYKFYFSKILLNPRPNFSELEQPSQTEEHYNANISLTHSRNILPLHN